MAEQQSCRSAGKGHSTKKEGGTKGAGKGKLSRLGQLLPSLRAQQTLAVPQLPSGCLWNTAHRAGRRAEGRLQVEDAAWQKLTSCSLISWVPHS